MTPAPSMSSLAEPSGNGSSRGLVLVVEDERPIADLLRLYLSRDGFGVQIETDGRSGLAAIRSLHPVAIVLDVGLPGMDGTEVCRRLRAVGDWTPVLFVTARDDEIDRVLGLELGAASPIRTVCGVGYAAEETGRGVGE